MPTRQTAKHELYHIAFAAQQQRYRFHFHNWLTNTHTHSQSGITMSTENYNAMNRTRPEETKNEMYTL